MKHNQEFAELQSDNPVIREMAYIANRILSDPLLKKQERAELIRRLEAEYHAYKLWNKQYTSYFRTPRSRDAPNDQPSNSAKKKGHL